MRVKNLLTDLLGSSRICKLRTEKIKAADGKTIERDYINELAKKLHPGVIKAVVTSIKKETTDSVRIRLSSDNMPYFAAGTYLSMSLDIESSKVSRAYSIVSTPMHALKEHYVEIIVKDYKDGFVSKYLNHELRINQEVEIEVGLGHFTYNKFRDTKNIVAIAGGAGITPFLSIANDIIDRDLDLTLTILYGSDNPNNIIAKEELDELSKDKRIKVIHVISGKYDYDGEKGFINRDIIDRYIPKDPTFFVCGPKVMYDFIKKEISALGYDVRRIRKESFSSVDLSKCSDYDKSLLDKEFKINVHQGLLVTSITAKAKESIAVALERAGLKIKTNCRAGECGVCRIKVLSGTYYIPNEFDYRRGADKDFNYVHSCQTYPTSDMDIKINIG